MRVACSITAFLGIVYAIHMLMALDLSKNDASDGVKRVIVVGGGLAGLSATLEALKASETVSVILIDKARLGGNSAKATSGISAAETPAQSAHRVEDSIELFLGDILASGGSTCEQQLAHLLSAKSAEAVQFLEENTQLNLSAMVQLGGHSVQRTHRIASKQRTSPLPLGYVIIQELKKVLASSRYTKRLKIFENTRVTNLVFNSETSMDQQMRSVEGVEVEANEDLGSGVQEGGKHVFRANAVVLSSGGFAADIQPLGLVAQYSSRKGYRMFTTNGPFATGDLQRIALNNSLETIDLNAIQLHPTSFVDPAHPLDAHKFLCPEAIRGLGAILLDRRGSRFVNELDTRDAVSDAILKAGVSHTEWGLQDGSNATKEEKENDTRMALLLMNEDIRERLGYPVFDFYVKKGFIIGPVPLEKLQTTYDFTVPLRTTLENYRDYSNTNGKGRDPYGKKIFPVLFSENAENFYYAFVTPAYHYTMGGLRINEEAQVFDARTKAPILNLFAAGELVGGVHGANRLGGNGMLESVVFGRVAGNRAAHLAEHRSPGPWNPRDMTLTTDPFLTTLRIRSVADVPTVLGTEGRAELGTPTQRLMIKKIRFALPFLDQRGVFPNNQTLVRCTFEVRHPMRRHPSQNARGSEALRGVAQLVPAKDAVGYVDAVAVLTHEDALQFGGSAALQPGDVATLAYVSPEEAEKDPFLHYWQQLNVMEGGRVQPAQAHCALLPEGKTTAQETHGSSCGPRDKHADF